MDKICLRKGFWLKVSALCLTLILAVLMVGSVFPANHALNNGVGKGSIMLVRPALAETGQPAVTFLDEEAGISLYLNLNRAVNLSKVKGVFKNIEAETPDYIIGSVSLPNLPESEDVHCFIHRSGWVVVYYLKDEPASKIIDWSYYAAGKFTKNKLEVGLEKVLRPLGLKPTNTKYYHFQYPSANHLTIIIDTEISGKKGQIFKFKIPSEFTVYEGSWSRGTDTSASYGKLKPGSYTPGEFHQVTIEGKYRYNLTIDGKDIGGTFKLTETEGVAIVLIYEAP